MQRKSNIRGADFFALFLLVLVGHFAVGQDYAQPDRPRAREEYCLVSALPKPFSTKIHIAVDVGQEVSSIWGGRKHQVVLTDGDGRPIAFNGMIDALNHMASDGWTLVRPNLSEGECEVKCCMMKRKVEEVREERSTEDGDTEDGEDQEPELAEKD